MILPPVLAVGAGGAGESAQRARLLQAEQAFRKSLDARPDARDVLLGLGQTLIELGRAAEAIPYLQRAVRLAPDNRPAKRALGRAYFQALGFGYA